MSKELHISDDLSLPLEAVTRTFAIMGIRGSGKTHTATVMVEEMLKAGQPVCIYDPVGAWFGLKTSANGKRPGFPVVIFGGEHQDVPLEEAAGEMIAKVIVERRISAILDCSLMRKGARVRFMADFCETLYHINREPLHFVADEAHTIAPLIIPKSDKGVPAARLLGAVEDMILLGRRRGLGATIVSQRPALVNASVRTQCESLIAMRVVGPHDLKAIREWTDAHGTPEQATELLSTLPMLKTGEGWFWSVWVDLFQRLMFRQRETFDSSATPKVGQKIIAPQVVAEIDLATLGEQIKATVEKAKADDPKALRTKIIELQKELARRPAAKVETKVIEKPVVTDKQISAVEGIVGRLEAEGQRRVEDGQRIQQTAREFAAAMRAVTQQSPVRPAPRPALAAPTRRPEHHARQQTSEASGDLTGPERKILNAVAWLESVGIPEPEQTAVAFLAGYTFGGGGFNNPKGSLNTKGFVRYISGGKIALTDEGRALAEFPADPLTTDELHRKVLDVLPGPERKILSVLLAEYPRVMSNEELSEAAGYTHGGGGYNNPRGRLRTLGLIEYQDGGVVARPILFLEEVAASRGGEPRFRD